MAATKSVVEQALFYRSLLGPWEKASPMAANQQQACRKAQEVLETELDPALVRADCPGAGDLLCRPQRRRGRGTDAQDERNHAQEERLPRRHLRGARHRRDHAAARKWSWSIDPFPAEIEKFKTTLVDGVGMTVIAVAERGDRAADDPHSAGRRLPDGAAIVGRLEHSGPRGRGPGDQPRQGRAGPQNRQRIRRRRDVRTAPFGDTSIERGVDKVAANITYTPSHARGLVDHVEHRRAVRRLARRRTSAGCSSRRTTTTW